MNSGDKIDQYTLIRSLGAGGMSEVYLVRDNLGKLYALKVLSASLTKDNSFRERFKVEAQIMASLNHPNIIGLHSYFEEQGHYCLVMEYLEGGSLKDLIRRTGLLPEERALPIFWQIGEALAYAHSQGIIHRDVKSSNIMISAEGIYKLGDFGIARMQETEGLTRTGSRMGTLIYMSPEQIEDSKHIDAKTDVYSLGVTLYEMLTGRTPYDETTESDYHIMNKIVQQDLPDPRTVYPHISDTTIKLLKLTTFRDPALRPQFDQLLSGTTSLLTSELESATQIITEPDESSSQQSETFILPTNPKKINDHGVWWVIGLTVILILVISIVILGSRRSAQKAQDKESTTASTYRESFDMVFVQGGTYCMGSNDVYESEQPVHEVKVSSFYLSKYQVTTGQWHEIMGDDISHFEGDNLPIVFISWFDAVDFCNQLSRLEGLTPCYSKSGGNIRCDWKADGYRLPTEAEWEFAARGGNYSEGYRYSGSDEIESVGWYGENSGHGTNNVGGKRANELGLYDMSGNVWEWCWDWYSDSYYSRSPKNNPTGPRTGDQRSLRGGCWVYDDYYCRVSSREDYPPYYGNYDIGFRVCRTAR